MNLMMNLQRLAEVRHNLSNLAYLASVIDPGPDLTDELHNELEELDAISTDIFPSRKIAKETEPVDPIIELPIQEKITRPAALPSVPGVSRRVPLSTCYNPERYVPYKVLWAKVIIRAAYDYALWRESKDMRLRKYAQDAERWIFESSNLALSFESICFAFDFPVERIRKRTRALTKYDVKKLEFRERHGRVEAPVEVISGDSE